MARELEIEISVETTQAQQALAQVETGLAKVGEAAKTADKAIDGNTKALGGQAKAAEEAAGNTKLLLDVVQKYAGPTVILAAVRQTLAFADQLGELAEQTGFSIKAIQQLGNVAERSGSSFQQVASAVAQLDNRLEKGDKSASTAIRNIGLSVEGLLKMKPDERFKEIAIAIASIEDPAKRTQTAIALFGRSGAQLIPTFLAIKDGAHEAGLVLSDEFVRAGASAQDQLDLLVQSGKAALAYFLTWPLVLEGWANSVAAKFRAAFGGAWESFKLFAVGGSVNMPTAPGSPGSVASQIGRNAALPVPGLPDNLTALENELTQAVRANIEARTRNTRAATSVAKAESFLASVVGFEDRAGITNSEMRFMPGFANITNTMGASLPTLSARFNNNLVPFAAPVQSALGGGGSGGGGLSRFLSGRGGALLGGGIGLLSSLIPGMSGTGGAIGSTAGATLGMVLGGPLAPLLGPLAGLAGGLVGRLFGGGEGRRVNDQRDAFVSQFGDINKLNAQLQEAGLNVDRLLKAKTEKGLKSAIDEINAALEQQQADADRVRTAMEKYNLTMADMGQNFKQGEITKGFKELGEDVRVLVGAGADFTAVAEKMAPAFGDLIQTAIETGTTVPRELEPILKKMIEMGVLVDRNGEKFTDLEQIPFAESLTEGFDRVVAAINKLSDLLGGIPAQFDAASRAAAHFAETAGSLPVGAGEPAGFDGGGVAGRDWRRPSARDVIPALLRPGEVVLTPEQARSGRGVALSIGTLSVGQFGSRGDAVEEIGESVVRYLERRGRRLVA